jgi:hypothetical protein
MLKLVSFMAASLALFQGAAVAAPNWPCLNPPTLSNDFPADTVLSDQQSFNCFAWQEFIALNWPDTKDAKPSDFGAEPGAAVAFERFKSIHDLMTPGDAPPKAFEHRGIGPQASARKPAS